MPQLSFPFDSTQEPADETSTITHAPGWDDELDKSLNDLDIGGWSYVTRPVLDPDLLACLRFLRQGDLSKKALKPWKAALAGLRRRRCINSDNSLNPERILRIAADQNRILDELARRELGAGA